ncbi:histidine phosphatase family protein [Streptomyces sp. ACA25]|uniref:histidine phosphatase family protein n=1 Tax=Streptomyces sp. ACA25 TaxID=3022596 RepID=UPI0023079831|nr:histidine phosphatase family protein [Streptomyces sp. ACA25]MDB1088711.1 histidine phosphatase family protein [Streptomyces sp. ACA25]
MENVAYLAAVRHGESTANAAFAAAAEGGSPEPLAGIDAEVELSELGRQQARLLGRWLAALPAADVPQAVVCSPYRRTRQTWEEMAAEAARLGAAGAPAVLTDERLRDREMGVFELHQPAALRARDPQEADRRVALGEWIYRPPGGESLADVALRVRSFLADLVSSGHERVLLVGHDATVVCVDYVLAGLGAAPPKEQVPNASVSTWRHGEREEVGMTSHLVAGAHGTVQSGRARG